MSIFALILRETRGVKYRIKDLLKWVVLPKMCPQVTGWEEGFQTLQRIFDVQSFEWEAGDCFWAKNPSLV